MPKIENKSEPRLCPKCEVITDRYRDGHCKPCNVKTTRRRYKDKGKTYRDNRRFRDTGCSPELYAALYAQQEGCCEICGTFKETLSADHDHNSKTFRGLLCQHCNFVLGHGRDNPHLLRQCADYLERKSSGN